MSSELNNPPVLLSPFAESGDKNIIPEAATGNQNASLEEGFPPITSQPLSQGGIPPERKDFNGLGYLLSSQYFYLQNGGRFTFNQDVSEAIGGYPLGAILQYYDAVSGDFYQVRSLINNNTYNFVTTPAYIDGAKWKKIDIPTVRNIGEIVESCIPLIDSNLHLLDGSVIENGIYDIFISHMATLYGDGSDVPEYFCTEQEWQQSVATYGVCGKFVYDSVNNTVRLPQLTGFIEGTTDPTALGDLIEAGMPNITGHVGSRSSSSYTYGSITGTPSGSFTLESKALSSGFNTISTTSSLSSLDEVNFDASLSNPIYGNSTTVQPQAIYSLFYIVLATAKKTLYEVDIDEIATDLNEKVNVRDLVSVATVIEKGSSSDGRWYRIWSDGWIEQGGFATRTGETQTVTFLKTFADTNYNIQISVRHTSNSTDGRPPLIRGRTTTTFTLNIYTSYEGAYWLCQGNYNIS